MQDSCPVDNSVPIWDEAKTRNKFDVESPKTLTKGSINSLVEALTDTVVVENEFNSALFLTYRSYIHPFNLLKKLMQRFRVPQEYERQSSRIQFRCVVAMREMLQSCVSTKLALTKAPGTHFPKGRGL